jgi:hypothetical protein
MRKVGAVVLLLAACAPRGGEGWAKKHLGEEGKESIRSDAQVMATSEGMLAGKVGKTPYLPRPYVVLQFPDGESRPFFHDMNLEIDPPSSAEAVRGIVVLRAEYKVDNKPGFSRKQRGHNEYAIFLVDRSARTMTIEHAVRADNVPTILAGLPSAP